MHYNRRVEERQQFVTLSEMARLLRGARITDSPEHPYEHGDFSPERVKLIARLGYLKFHEGDETKVVLPSASAIRWLRAMLLPLPERPLFTLHEITELLASTPRRARKGSDGAVRNLIKKLCAAYSIPIHFDEAWGEMLSPTSFIDLLDALHGYRTPARFDRLALIEWMRTINPKRRLRWNLPYSKLLEGEIRRIVRLDEPERTMRAVALWEAYRDAKMISNCLGNYRDSMRRKMEVTENRLAGMMKKLTGVEIHMPAFPSDPLAQDSTSDLNSNSSIDSPTPAPDAQEDD
jgi:hypothetical protein